MALKFPILRDGLIHIQKFQEFLAWYIRGIGLDPNSEAMSLKHFPNISLSGRAFVYLGTTLGLKLILKDL